MPSGNKILLPISISGAAGPCLALRPARMAELASCGGSRAWFGVPAAAQSEGSRQCTWGTGLVDKNWILPVGNRLDKSSISLG